MLGSSPRGCCSSHSHGISHSTYFGHILGASPIGLPPLRVPQCAGASLLTLQTRLGLISPSLAAQRGKPVVQGARNPPEQGQQTQTWSAPGRAQPLIWVQQQEADRAAQVLHEGGDQRHLLISSTAGQQRAAQHNTSIPVEICLH